MGRLALKRGPGLGREMRPDRPSRGKRHKQSALKPKARQARRIRHSSARQCKVGNPDLAVADHPVAAKLNRVIRKDCRVDIDI